ncbi:hypothetical protein KIW84_020249 [Lathyrus oleraceus]|uniref:Uncharacterized protein n=1 Tax=Pisum sativum TaxID=3888 RepID=A0A9D4Y8I4_PEA|nr:hypothetical protein KIW84_020249 [Pisum sativum]
MLSIDVDNDTPSGFGFFKFKTPPSAATEPQMQPVLSPCNHLVCSSCMADGLTISSEYALGNTKYAQIDLRHVINSEPYGASIDLIEVAVILPKQQQTMSNCYKIKDTPVETKPAVDSKPPAKLS